MGTEFDLDLYDAMERMAPDRLREDLRKVLIVGPQVYDTLMSQARKGNAPRLSITEVRGTWRRLWRKVDVLYIDGNVPVLKVQPWEYANVGVHMSDAMLTVPENIQVGRPVFRWKLPTLKFSFLKRSRK